MCPRGSGDQKSRHAQCHTHILILTIHNTTTSTTTRMRNAFGNTKIIVTLKSSSSMLSLKHMVRENNYLELTQEHTNYTDADIGCYCHSIFLFDRQQNTQALVKGLETFES